MRNTLHCKRDVEHVYVHTFVTRPNIQSRFQINLPFPLKTFIYVSKKFRSKLQRVRKDLPNSNSKVLRLVAPFRSLRDLTISHLDSWVDGELCNQTATGKPVTVFMEPTWPPTESRCNWTKYQVLLGTTNFRCIGDTQVENRFCVRTESWGTGG